VDDFSTFNRNIRLWATKTSRIKFSGSEASTQVKGEEIIFESCFINRFMGLNILKHQVSIRASYKGPPQGMQTRKSDKLSKENESMHFDRN